MTDILSRRYRKSPNLVFRQIADEYVLVPIHQDVADMEAVYTLDGVGAYIWELLDGQRDGYAILELIIEEYNVESEQALNDLVEFLEQLNSIDGISPLGEEDGK
ncbi:MAG: PqqD family protein [Chloroflexia bacterium]|nr:PqqD family protein [Chloroflexia bacterium]